MSSSGVRFERIQIEKALGIERGSGFEVTGLSPGINIIHGPNGCGKSTLCRVAHELMWPGEISRPTISGHIADGQDAWEVGIEAGFVESRRNGRAEPAPDFGPAESRRRYHLHLRDLIVDRNEDFARKIADAVRGGYDLDAAANAIGARATVSRPNNDIAALRKAREHVDAAQGEQHRIEQQARRIDDLKVEHDRAVRAQDEYDLLTKVRAYHNQSNDCEELKRRLDEFPRIVSLLRGDEAEVLSELASKEERLRAQLRDARRSIAEAEQQRSKADLPQDGIAPEVLVRLEALKRDLESAEQHVAEQERRYTEAEKKSETARRLLGSHLTESQLAALEAVEQPDLTRFSERVEMLRAREHAISAERERLQADAPGDDQLSRDDIRSGMRALTDWLAVEEESRPLSQKLTVAALVGATLATIASFVFGPAWLGVLPFVVVIAVAWSLIKERQRRDLAQHRRDDAERGYPAQLPPPTAWRRRNVRDALEELSARLAAQEHADERLRRLKELERDEQALQSDRNKLIHERDAIRAQLGIEAIEVDDAWLRLVVQRIGDWQSAASVVISIKAVLDADRATAQAHAAAINQIVSAYGYDPVDTSAGADAVIVALNRRNTAHTGASDIIRSQTSLIATAIEPELEEIASTRRRLFERLALTADDHHHIREGLERLIEYNECKQNHTREDGALQARLREVHTGARVLKMDPDGLLDLNQYELDRKIEAADEMRSRRDSLGKEIGQIEESIAAAKRGHSLTDALQAFDEAQAKLDDSREENRKAVVGHLISDWVRDTSVDASRPRVFLRARELFVTFTSGALTLELDDRSSPPAFLARTHAGHVRSLDELSDGERIQLMTAVRLAFLEQDERRRLPLFIDEVLGTSDDDRSRVMIDTVMEVARTGRQVFYFTAQLDEVGKWQSRLSESDVEHEVIDLAEVRRGYAGRSTPLITTPVERPRPPAPGEMSYTEYGKALGVPGIDPISDSVDTLHLWHVLDDAALLHRLLNRNIDTWGRLRVFLEYGGASILSDSPGTIDRIRAAVRAVETACDAFRIGRGRPVDCEVLIDSGAVTDSFIDRVSALCSKVNGEAQAILDALERGEVSRFRSASITDLRDHFKQNGYLPDQAPLSPDDLRVRVLAAASADIDAGLITTDYIDRVLSVLP